MFWSGKKRDAPYCHAIITAAGDSSRMGGAGGKMFELLDGIPVLARAAAALGRCDYVGDIIIASRESDLVHVGRMIRDYGLEKVTKVVRGGDTRQRSVLAALAELPPDTEYVAVHDGARPLVSDGVVSSVIAEAFRSGAAIPAVPLKDTVKTVRDGAVASTPNRSELFSVQTPQVFRLHVINAALISAEKNGVTYSDDSAAVEVMGESVRIVAGDYRNIKITTPEDLDIAEFFLRRGFA